MKRSCGMHSFTRRSCAGYTIVELVISVTVSGVIASGVIAIGAYVWADYQAENFSKRMDYLVQDIEGLYASRITYEGLDLTSAIQLGLIRYEQVQVGATAAASSAKHLYNKAITLGSLTGSSFNNQAWGLHYSQLPPSACVSIVQHALNWGYAVAIVPDPDSTIGPTSFSDWENTTRQIKMVDGKVEGFPSGYQLIKSYRTQTPSIQNIATACLNAVNAGPVGPGNAFGLAIVLRRL